MDVSEMYDYRVDSERRIAFSRGDVRGHGLHLTCRVRKAPHSVQCSQTPSKPGRELCWRDATEHGSGERRRGHVGAQGAHSPRAPHRAPSKLPGVGPCCNLRIAPCVWQALLLLFKADPAPEKRGHKAVLPLAQAYAKNPKHKHHAVAGEMIKLLSDIKYVETKKPALEEKVKKMIETETIRLKRNTQIVAVLLLGTAVYFYFFHGLGADQEL